ncbi:MAG: leucyl aminopeptidase [Candidatus Marinimicrobia bacterium]|jgi:leucyl aminopeptidase|nr:leucyl aminopeptidase [Candidatus Neomarinimicrobiota bacterium]MDP6593358.1 leucyl aminopeptidase [Candidatus Neomarinimicrobiota bacterium]MDP6967416.1 leucyl aminopeptidase [Candidatus Neomarinimicrobiota bacterium]|tara:strand:+ start:11190 stop:12677 length:1488 start_codon:yes stop_codon:yes gene_type:complete
MAYVKRIQITRRSLDSLSPEVLVLGLFEDGELSDFHKNIDEAAAGALSQRIEIGDFEGKAGKTLSIFPGKPANRILLVGLGKREDFTLDRLRQAAGTAVKTVQASKIDTMASEVPGGDALKSAAAEVSQAWVEGLILGSYRFLDYKSDTEDATVMNRITLINGASRVGVERGRAVAEAVCFARDLANHPSNVATPARLVTEARRIARSSGMRCKVMGRDQFTQMGMGAFASVARGADEPPKFILIQYSGGKKGEKPFAFVGKGITFDTGGISIKPSSKMDEMKFDMCGAATVLGIMQAVGRLKPKVNIVGAIAATENMPGGHATKPGDIVRAYNGKTIEILNTDAEGRLVLADALAYVSQKHDPRYMVNFATLTGAVIIALGHVASGVMGNDEKLIDAIRKAAEASGEKVWPLPLWDEYCDDIKSKIADVKNLGAPRQAGTIAGGAFLKEFVGETPWAHVDIAGTAWRDKDQPYMPAGPSGVGIRLSLELLNILG